LYGEKTFVYAEIHASYHGLDTLAATAVILKEDPEIRIVMVGDGPERKRLRGLVREKRLENLIFPNVPYEKTRELYSLAYAAVATLRDLPVHGHAALESVSCVELLAYLSSTPAMERRRNC
jgi:glycosyltransferase involved in cell wall biosynthesis